MAKNKTINQKMASYFMPENKEKFHKTFEAYLKKEYAGIDSSEEYKELEALAEITKPKRKKLFRKCLKELPDYNFKGAIPLKQMAAKFDEVGKQKFIEFRTAYLETKEQGVEPVEELEKWKSSVSFLKNDYDKKLLIEYIDRIHAHTLRNLPKPLPPINWATERKYGADLSLAEAYDENKKVSINGKIDSRAYSLHQSDMYWEQMRHSDWENSKHYHSYVPEACYETLIDWIDGGSDGEDLRYLSELIECDDEDMRDLAEWGFSKEEAEDVYKASQDSSIDLNKYIYDNYVEVKPMSFEDICFVFDIMLTEGEDYVKYKCPVCGEETFILNKELCQERNDYGDFVCLNNERRYEEYYGEYWGKCWKCREYIKTEDLKDIVKEEEEL